jgi:SagB-type dehydrogenase family enzyme
MATDTNPPVKLPAPRTDSTMSVEAALAARRTIRDFQPHALTEAEIGQLLWAAQGVTRKDGKRTAPSASATFPLETYVITAEGLGHYLPDEHALEPIHDRDMRAEMKVATGHQRFVDTAPLIVAFTTVASRTAVKHGEDRAVRYADFECGHALQNLMLQAVALDLGSVAIGKFVDDEVGRLLDLPEGEVPRYMVAVGRPIQK